MYAEERDSSSVFVNRIALKEGHQVLPYQGFFCHHQNQGRQTPLMQKQSLTLYSAYSLFWSVMESVYVFPPDSLTYAVKMMWKMMWKVMLFFFVHVYRFHESHQIPLFQA